MANEKLIVAAPADTRRRLAPDTDQAWRWIGWYAFILTLVGLGDWFLALVPPHFGNPEWEFGTIASVLTGLPLVTMGFAGLLGAGVARGQRWLVILMSWLLLAFAVMIIGVLIVFLLDVPLALRAATPLTQSGLLKIVAKTAMVGFLFSVAYIVAAVGALRRLRAKA